MAPPLGKPAYQQYFQNTLDTYPLFKQHSYLLKKIKNAFEPIWDTESNT